MQPQLSLYLTGMFCILIWVLTKLCKGKVTLMYVNFKVWGKSVIIEQTEKNCHINQNRKIQI